MNVELIKRYLDKKIIVILKNEFKYEGYIDKLYNDSFSLNDIVTDKLIAISFDEISIMKESKEVDS